MIWDRSPAPSGTPLRSDNPTAVGDSLMVTGAGNPGRDRVVVTATLVDGSVQIVLDIWV